MIKCVSRFGWGRRAVGPFFLGIRPPPIGYSTFNRLCLEGYVFGHKAYRAETGPSPDWRRSHPGAFLQLSHASGRHSGRPVAQTEGGRALRAARPRPHTGSLSPPSPQERPAVDAAARLDSAREAVRKGACTRGYRTPVTAGIIRILIQPRVGASGLHGWAVAPAVGKLSR